MPTVNLARGFDLEFLRDFNENETLVTEALRAGVRDRSRRG